MLQIQQHHLEQMQNLCQRRQAALELYRQDYERTHGPVSERTETHMDDDGESFDDVDGKSDEKMTF